MDYGLHEEGHEAELDAVLLLEALLVVLAKRHHRTHVYFIEGGEDRRGGLRLDQPLRDALAQPRHRHALLRAPGKQLVDVDRGGRLLQRGLWSGLLNHIRFGNPAIPPRALYLSCIDAFLRSDLLRRG